MGSWQSHGVRAGKFARQVLALGLSVLGLQRRPCFLIIGAMKCGTTSLHNYLTEHPQLWGAGEKEVSFFDQNVNYRRGFAWYHSKFPIALPINENFRLFESTPSYLYYPWVPERIRTYDRNMKLIALVRDPVSRAYSEWNMWRHRSEAGTLFDKGRWDARTRVPLNRLMWRGDFPDFRQCIEREIQAISASKALAEPHLLARGIYFDQLERYFAHFPREQVLVLDSGALKTNRIETLDSIARYLDVAQHAWTKQSELHLVGEYSKPMSGESKEMLREFYKPYNERLFNLLGREYKWK